MKKKKITSVTSTDIPAKSIENMDRIYTNIRSCANPSSSLHKPPD